MTRVLRCDGQLECHAAWPSQVTPIQCGFFGPSRPRPRNRKDLHRLLSAPRVAHPVREIH